MLTVKVHKEKQKHQRSKAPSSGEVLFVDQHHLKNERLHLAHPIFLYAKVDSADGRWRGGTAAATRPGILCKGSTGIKWYSLLPSTNAALHVLMHGM